MNDFVKKTTRDDAGMKKKALMSVASALRIENRPIAQRYFRRLKRPRGRPFNRTDKGRR